MKVWLLLGSLFKVFFASEMQRKLRTKLTIEKQKQSHFVFHRVYLYNIYIYIYITQRFQTELLQRKVYDVFGHLF